MQIDWNSEVYPYKIAFKKALKMAFWAILIGAPIWHFVVKRPVYQYLYGIPSAMELTITPTDIFEELPDKTPPSYIKGKNLNVQIDFLKFFHTVTRIAYVDRYNFIGTWYRTSHPDERYRKAVKVYDTVAPLDLTTINGNNVRTEMLKCMIFDHEYRGSTVKFKETRECYNLYNRYYENHNINNNHTIPANTTVAKGLEILKAGDIAYLEGYVVEWKDTETGDVMLSSTYVGQVHDKQLYGGRRGAGFCRQLFLTRIIFDGYEFK